METGKRQRCSRLRVGNYPAVPEEPSPDIQPKPPRLGSGRSLSPNPAGLGSLPPCRVSLSLHPKTPGVPAGSGCFSCKTLRAMGLDPEPFLLAGTKARGVIVSARSPHLFSCGQLGQVKCWDVEYNKVIRHYHGRQSNVYGLDLHPTIDVLVTCGRDSTARVWDPRAEVCVHTRSGHKTPVASVRCHAIEAEIITASHDTTVRLWDLVAADTRVTLRNHRKPARAVVVHPIYNTFASGSSDNIKQWKFPNGAFIQNLSGHNACINTLAVNSHDVLVSGAGDGSVHFWDWTTGQCFQSIQAAAQTGCWDSDSGIFACAFDQSGRTLLTVGADKTIRLYGEDDTVTEEYHHVM